MTKIKLRLIIPIIIMFLITVATSLYTVINNMTKTNETEIEYSTTWSSDDEYHWHRALDSNIDSVKDKAPHNYGDWYIDSSATESSDGSYARECSICHHHQYQNIPFSSPFVLKLNDDNSYSIISVKNISSTELTIPSSINNIPVKSIETEAFKDCTNLTTITIGANINNIGADAFKDTVNITRVNYLGKIENWPSIKFENEFSNPVGYSKNLFIDDKLVIDIVIPKSLKSIGEYVFYGFECIKSVHYLSTIEDYCNIEFAHEYSNPTWHNADLYINDAKQNKLTIPSTITKINKYAFYGAEISSLILPSELEEISDYAFYNDKKLSSITFGENLESCSLTKIGKYAFSYCITLSEITLPEGLKEISDYAFYNDTSLFNLNLNSDLETIGKSSFANCTKLESFSAPTGLKTIDDEAFMECSNLSNITFNEALLEIGNYAFYNDKNILNVYFPQNITKIGEYAFYNCNRIESLILNNLDIEEISAHSFEKCSSLTEVTLGEKLVKISDYAFAECSSLTEITILDNVTTIGEYAFYKCSNLLTLTLGKNVDEIKDYAFYEDVKLIEIFNNSSLTLVSGSTDHGYVAYYAKVIHNIIEESVIVKDNENYFIVYENQGYFLNYEGNDETFKVPETFLYNGEIYTVVGIYDNAFLNNDKIKEVTLPSHCITIGDNAFKNCINLMTINLSNVLTTIGENAFENDQYLTSIILPLSLTEIKDNAFKDCYRLVEIYNLSTLNIENDNPGLINDHTLIIHTLLSDLSILVTENQFIFAFIQNNPLVIAYIGNDKEIVLPNSFTYYGNIVNRYNIGEFAFYEAEFEEITLPSGLTRISESAFEKSAIIKINLPKSLTTIEANAFNLCNNLSDVYYGGTEEMFYDMSIDLNNDPLIYAKKYFEIEEETFEDEWTYDDIYHWHKSLDPDSINVKDKDFHTITIWNEDEEPDEEGIYYENGICDICGDEITRVHEHKFSSIYEYNDEYHWQRALCSHILLITNYSEHIFSDWTVIVEATIDDDGYQERECVYCGYKETEVIYQLDHEHVFSDEYTYDADFHWHPAICVHKYSTSELKSDIGPHTFIHLIEEERRDDGNYYEVDICTICGYIGNETLHYHTTDEPNIYAYDMNNHWNIPNCRNVGSESIMHVSEKANEASHVFSEWYNEVEKDGKKYHTRDCEICGALFTEEIIEDEESEN